MSTLVEMKLYCTCGAAWSGKTKFPTAQALMKSWKENHTGEGHAACDAKTAARARRKAELKSE